MKKTIERTVTQDRRIRGEVMKQRVPKTKCSSGSRTAHPRRVAALWGPFRRGAPETRPAATREANRGEG